MEPKFQLRDKFNQQLQTRGTVTMKDLIRLFKNMDKPRNMTLTFEKFFNGQINIGCGLSKDDAKVLFDFFDTDGSGTISMSQLLFGLRGSLNEKR